MRQGLSGLLVLSLTLSPAIAVKDKKAGETKAKSPGGSRLEGKVTGQDGKPIRGAAVAVRLFDGETTWTSQPSDSKGRFRLEQLPYGWADLMVTTDDGVFLGDQAINLPPGTKVVVNFSLLSTADKPATWWTDRRVERPAGMTQDQLSGMAQSSQRLTGVEYWKSPGGIAVLVSVTVVALGLIAAGGGKYKAPSAP